MGQDDEERVVRRTLAQDVDGPDVLSKDESQSLEICGSLTGGMASCCPTRRAKSTRGISYRCARSISWASRFVMYEKLYAPVSSSETLRSRVSWKRIAFWKAIVAQSPSSVKSFTAAGVKRRNAIFSTVMIPITSPFGPNSGVAMSKGWAMIWDGVASAITSRTVVVRLSVATAPVMPRLVSSVRGRVKGTAEAPP